ncbi:MAG TPA: hypothetical protein PKV71_14495 [Calditrichia bacterium]|nr:hypothetical protein [Calditrichota bacterium]HQU72788.1 hypothetical protein [Calditrichia bacterium]HQV33091.1 hypothetical protein [Calditrichia bacterium]
MDTFLAVTALFVVAFGFFGLMLHFSQYRKRSNAMCCTDALEEFEKGDDCDTCPNKENDECAIHQIKEEQARQSA